MLELILSVIIASILGIFAGTITGLLPGIHINLISAFLLTVSAFFLSINPIILVAFIVAMTLAHTFLDFIPSIFLGAPDENNFLSILPGHELLLKGKGFEAVILTLFGGLLGVILVLFFSPIFIFLLPKIYSYLKFVMLFLLVFANLYLILKEKNSKLTAIIVFFLSGFLGLITLVIPSEQSLLPLLSGLFGSSSLIMSIMKKQKIPKQDICKIKKIKISKREIANSSLASILAAPLCAFLPALGTGQAAVIGSDIVPVKRREFLIMLGIINTMIAALSFITLYSIDKARTGTAVAVQSLLDNFTLSSLIIILIVIILSSLVSFFIAIFVSKIFARNLSKLNYQYLSVFILIFLSIVVLIFSGILGFFIFLIATSIGLFTILSGVRRTHMMGSLMLPAIWIYLPIF